MGTCCCGNKPSDKFVGTWTDDQHVELQIDGNGVIQYRRQMNHTNTKFSGPTRFSGDKFFFCCCCCSLRGRFTDDDDYKTKLIANRTVLTKRREV